jgi:hypothetical protein
MVPLIRDRIDVWWNLATDEKAKPNQDRRLVFT